MCCEPMRKEKMGSPTYCNCGCWHTTVHRHFFSRQEERELLENYRVELEQELEGVKRKMEELTL